MTIFFFYSGKSLELKEIFDLGAPPKRGNECICLVPSPNKMAASLLNPSKEDIKAVIRCFVGVFLVEKRKASLIFIN